MTHEVPQTQILAAQAAISLEESEIYCPGCDAIGSVPINEPDEHGDLVGLQMANHSRGSVVCPSCSGSGKIRPD